MSDGQQLHVMHILEGTAGGSRKHLRYVATALRDAGHTVDLVLSTRLADPDFSDDLALYRQEGCQLFLVDMDKGLALSDLAAYRAIGRILRQRRPAIVHTHCAKAGLVGRLAARRALPSAKLVHTPHSYFFEGFHRQLAKGLGIRLERRLNRFTDLLFCISAAEQALIEEHRLMPPARVVVGPNGLPANFTANLLPRDAVRQELGLAPAQVAIGVFARMVAKKGHFWLLDAIRCLPEQVRAPLRVFFYGEGPIAGEVQRRICHLGLAGTVLYQGYKPAAERYLPGMDLAILPSFYEGLSYQLLEALGAGLPLIASDIPGNRFAHPDNPILYVEPDCPDDLADLIAGLAAAPADRQRLGQRGQAWIAKHFALESQMQTLRDAYRRLVEPS